MGKGMAWKYEQNIRGTDTKMLYKYSKLSLCSALTNSHNTLKVAKAVVGKNKIGEAKKLCRSGLRLL